jgi:hypothetical protein
MPKNKKRRLELLFFWLSAVAEVIVCVLHIWGEKWTPKGGNENHE